MTSQSRRYRVWVAFRHRGNEIAILGVFPTRSTAKDRIARDYHISWTDPCLRDRSTWTADGWTYEVRETVGVFPTRVLEVPDIEVTSYEGA